MEKFNTLGSYVQNEDQKLFNSTKLLEIFTGQRIQALQKIVEKDLNQLRKVS